ncbi:MAG TPA: DinB family protein [Bryobacteraceae bacterium]|nr:DinB family protein [Bryobacteraceae bacterium]
MKLSARSLFLPLIFACGAVSLMAQATPAKVVPGFRGLFLKQLDDVQSKVVGLAEAVPQEKYTWRPAEGVRSIAEVFGHIASANYGLPTFIGVKPPATFNRAIAKETDKAKLVEALKASFEHLRKIVEDMPDADLEKPTKLFGQDTTYEGVLFLTANHMHEHLGQSIAYARSNGVTPPWSKKGE